MLTKMRKKGKKGFTLVELIVVIAIIAILAAVAVPTTIHFVEKANISNEQSAIDIRQSLSGIFTDVMTGTVKDFKIATDSSDKLAPLLTEIAGTNGSIKYIKLEITKEMVGNPAQATGKYLVAYEIVGIQFPTKSKIAGKVDGKFTAEQLKITDAVTVYYNLANNTFTASATAAQ
ncbi:MAG: prepilin-type N-terminal cleavage/methylation domain-containing protein [Eubacteriales bacterium]|nr:prepilin-type N-terminal cleavage/methylation domain-containing protein [Eubacteriales bacterium]